MVSHNWMAVLTKHRLHKEFGLEVIKISQPKPIIVRQVKEENKN